MKNQNLRTDFNNIRGIDHDVNLVLTEAENYIEFLEGKEDRLTKLEGVLNDIEASDIPNKEAFLARFSEFKNA